MKKINLNLSKSDKIYFGAKTAKRVKEKEKDYFLF